MHQVSGSCSKGEASIFKSMVVSYCEKTFSMSLYITIIYIIIITFYNAYDYFESSNVSRIIVEILPFVHPVSNTARVRVRSLAINDEE